MTRRTTGVVRVTLKGLGDFAERWWTDAENDKVVLSKVLAEVEVV